MNPWKPPPVIFPGYKPPIRLPRGWLRPIRRIDRGLGLRCFDSFTSDGWVTSGACACRLPDGFHPSKSHVNRERSSSRIPFLNDGQPFMPGISAQTSDGPWVVRVGPAWVDERYLWLSHELFGRLTWWAHGEEDVVVGRLPRRRRALIAIAPIVNVVFAEAAA